jgi:hypothetical protein
MIFRSLGVRAPFYGFCPSIREFGCRLDRPLVDGAGIGGPCRGRRQSGFLPGFSRPMVAGVGSRLAGLCRVSVRDWLARIVCSKPDRDICPSRLYPVHGIICDSGPDVSAGPSSPDSHRLPLVGTDGLCRNAPALLSGFEEPGVRIGYSLSCDRCLGSHRIAALPTGTDRRRSHPLWRGFGHFESALACLH